MLLLILAAAAAMTPTQSLERTVRSEACVRYYADKDNGFLGVVYTNAMIANVCEKARQQLREIED